MTVGVLPRVADQPGPSRIRSSLGRPRQPRWGARGYRRGGHAGHQGPRPEPRSRTSAPDSPQPPGPGHRNRPGPVTAGAVRYLTYTARDAPRAVRARTAGSPPVLLHRAVAPRSRAWRRPAPPGRSATPGARRRPASRQLHHRASFRGFSCIQPNSGAGTRPAAPARSPREAPLHLEPGHLVNARAASAAEANNCRRADLAVIHPRCCHSRSASESPAITTSPNGMER